MAKNQLSSSLEDYLEAIYLLGKEKSFVHANKIAEFLDVGKSSVSWALKQLSNKKLIDYTPYEAISLTEKGLALAQRLAGRHEDIKSFLTDVLAVNETLAEANACRMEHVVDRDILGRMKQFMEFLQQCPRAGKEWMKGFGFFCQQGSDHQRCPECLSTCLQGLQDRASEPQDEPFRHVRHRASFTVHRLREVLHECGREFTPAEEIVAKLFIASEGHQTLDGLYQAGRQLDPKMTRQCVEETIQLLCEHKIARAVRFQDHLVYEHFHPESHHDHIFCVKCGGIVEFFDPRIEALQAENARRVDFRLLMHNLNIYGLCHDCIKKEATTRSIGACLNGERVAVTQVVAESQTQKRIAEMGLVPDVIVEVLSTNCAGDNVIITTGQRRLMLDADTAKKIKVVAVEPGSGFGGGHHRRHRRRLMHDEETAGD